MQYRPSYTGTVSHNEKSSPPPMITIYIADASFSYTPPQNEKALEEGWVPRLGDEEEELISQKRRFLRNISK